PALLVSALLPDAFDPGTKIQTWLEKATDFYILWALIHLANTFLQSVFDALDKRGKYKIHTMKGVLQMLKLFFIIIGVIIGISILFGKSPIAIITALGASAAVLMLIFQDSILGLVAGVQLTVNDMLKKGDWINVPKSNANGIVEDITLTTVKVRNWDNSVTTVPPYSLVKDSFMNYNPMITSGARRVSRFVYIDVNSIRFLDESEIEGLLKKNLIYKDNVSQLTREVNLSAFSRHIEEYLMQSPHVHTKSIVMVRQLQPTPEGIPLELYFFTNETEWKKYEHIQSDIFNYVYACAREFHLSIFQAPSGKDLKQITGRQC
ncbi:MAG: mechanosensitive ion channel family protein, partial [Muribaculaceae bacterium]|nr:mechanosensitive ion channel family protein [Muribaculaceae bacterium]